MVGVSVHRGVPELPSYLFCDYFLHPVLIHPFSTTNLKREVMLRVHLSQTVLGVSCLQGRLQTGGAVGAIAAAFPGHVEFPCFP